MCNQPQNLLGRNSASGSKPGTVMAKDFAVGSNKRTGNAAAYTLELHPFKSARGQEQPPLLRLLLLLQSSKFKHRQSPTNLEASLVFTF